MSIKGKHRSRITTYYLTIIWPLLIYLYLENIKLIIITVLFEIYLTFYGEKKTKN